MLLSQWGAGQSCSKDQAVILGIRECAPVHACFEYLLLSRQGLPLDLQARIDKRGLLRLERLSPTNE